MTVKIFHLMILISLRLILVRINHITGIKQEKRVIDGITKKEYRNYEELIKDNIEYEKMVADAEWANPQTGVTTERYDLEMLDKIVFVMLDTICSKKETIKIGGKEKPAAVVKNQLLKLSCEHSPFLIHRLNQASLNFIRMTKYDIAEITKPCKIFRHISI